MTAVSNMGAPAIVHAAQQRAEKTSTIHNALLVVAILLSTTSLVLVFFRRLWLNEHYRFFPIILAAFIWFVYARWPKEFGNVGTRDRIIAFSALVLGLMLQAAGVMLWSPWINVIGALFTGLFLLIHFAGGEALPRLGSCWLLLWLVVPPPANLDREFVLWLQSVSSRMSSVWLDAIGFNHVLSGHVIHVPGQMFLVEEACSGANSFFVMLSLTAVFVLAARYPVFPAISLLAAAIGWAIVANTLRIVSLVAFADAGVDLSQGASHTILGLVTFAIALALLYSTDRLLLFLMAPTAPHIRASDQQVDADDQAPQARPLIGNRMVGVVIALFVLIGIAQLRPASAEKMLPRDDVAQVVQAGLKLDASAVRAPSTEWKFIRFDREHTDFQGGFNSTTWEFGRGPTVALLSLDFPFRGWHELSYCYTAQGWTLSDRRILAATDVTVNETATLVFELERPTGGFGYVMVCLFDANGERLTPPPTTGWSWEGLKSIVLNRLTIRGSEGDEIRPVYQFQVFVTSEAPPTYLEQQRVAELYFAARQQVIQSIREAGA